MQREVTDDLDLLLEALPPHICKPLRDREDNHELLEIVMDLGRLPEARYPNREVILSDNEVTEADIDYVVSRIGEFGDDNRAGIERTLHRISAIRNRRGRIVGLTCRVGRAVYGTIQIIEDLVQSGKSLLLLGRPGVGKTTMLRETARVLADDLGKRVVIVDTSNEIAGDGDIPHPAIGSARRMQVPTPALQHATMIEAVENHMPEVIVIDEIGTELEAAAARTINERGVQLVGTAHGNELENLMLNPTLSDLIGGIQSVTLGDEEARRRGTQKSILERKAPPTFDVIVEIQSWQRVAVHENVADTVDAILRGFDAPPEVRELDENGEVRQVFEQVQPRSFEPVARGRRTERPERGSSESRVLARGRTEAARPVKRIFSVGVNKQRIEQAIRDTGVDAVLTEKMEDADVVFTLPTFFRKKPQSLRDAEARNLDVLVLKSNTGSRIMQALAGLRPASARPRDEVLEAMEETEEAIGTLITGNRHQVDLEPQNAYIRRIQHQIAQQFNVGSRSHGREPNRRVRVFRDGDTSLPFED
ncbi:MAG: R3H domain-containing nucleic acid-binding protein [Dehalococcoidia bacterium]